MDSEFVVEELKPSDKKEVLDLSSGIWEGHDYVPDLYDDWVENGGFICGKVDGEIIAIAKHTWQRGQVLWLEGLRVHPKHQGKGYARKMVEGQLEYIQELDYDAVRFLTSGDKESVKKLAAENGFEIKREYDYLRSDDEELEEIDALPVSEKINEISDGKKVADFVFSSQEYEDNASQYMEHWTTYDMDEELIKREVDEGKCYSIGENFDALAFFHYYGPYNSLSVPYIGGSLEGMKELLEMGLRWAVEREYDRYSIKTASEKVVKAVEEIGMSHADFETVILYEMK